jgi:hypothetical protein
MLQLDTSPLREIVQAVLDKLYSQVRLVCNGTVTYPNARAREHRGPARFFIAQHKFEGALLYLAHPRWLRTTRCDKFQEQAPAMRIKHRASSVVAVRCLRVAPVLEQIHFVPYGLQVQPCDLHNLSIGHNVAGILALHLVDSPQNLVTNFLRIHNVLLRRGATLLARQQERSE